MTKEELELENAALRTSLFRIKEIAEGGVEDYEEDDDEADD